jgi:uncharacterized SAM-dependent methyltransferase/transposase
MVQSVKNYLSNTKIAQKYNVSNPTVGEWIRNAVENKNNIKVELVKSKYRILDTEHNDAELTRLSQHAKRYKGSDNRKVVKVSKEFYEIFDNNEILEIITDLQFKKQVKQKYVYKKSQYWNNFYLSGQHLHFEKTKEAIFQSLELAPTYIDTKKANLIEIGQGNGLPAKDFIENLEKTVKVEKFVGLDISTEMNNLAKNNLNKFYPDLEKNFFKVDIERSTFEDYILESKNLSDEIGNIIVCIGATLMNIDDKLTVFKKARAGMITNDIFIFSFSLDITENKSLFNVKDKEGLLRNGWHLKLMGIDIEKCEIILEYNDKGKYKDMQYVLDKDYLLQFNIFNTIKEVSLYKGEKISTWRHYLWSKEDVLEHLRLSELEMVTYIEDKDCRFGVVGCKINTHN